MKFFPLLTGVGLSAILSTCQAAVGHKGLRSVEDPSERFLTNTCITDKKCAKPDCLKEGDCVICDNCDKSHEPTSITVQYLPNNPKNSKFQPYDKADCTEHGYYPSPARIEIKDKDGKVFQTVDVSDGDVFTIKNPKGFDAYTFFRFLENWNRELSSTTDLHRELTGNKCFFHTSCSVPLVTYDQIGPFLILSGGKCDGDCTKVEKPQCVICDKCDKQWLKKPGRELLLQYAPADPQTSKYLTSATCTADLDYPSVDQTNPTTITVDGMDFSDITAPYGSTFALQDVEGLTTFSFTNDVTCTIDFSCKEPIVVEDQIGPFIILDNGQCPIDPPERCVVCEKGDDRPTSLTFAYLSPGEESDFGNRGSCSDYAGVDFPDENTITVEGRTNDVEIGDRFTVVPEGGGSFGANTEFEFLSGTVDSCTIHTSCSQPLVLGDQMGPLKLVGSDNCEDCCDVFATAHEDRIVVEWSICEEVLDGDSDTNYWIAIYPCNAPLDTAVEGYKALPLMFQYLCWGTTGMDDCNQNPELDIPLAGTMRFYARGKYNQRFGNEDNQKNSLLGEGCFHVVLNSNKGPSPPAYERVCYGNKIYLDGPLVKGEDPPLPNP